ncbi:MAG: hypothetical protein HOI95_08315 [Chromatiales bacterium]|nr:hypothetical protein [Chromatiales bacterium]
MNPILVAALASLAGRHATARSKFMRMGAMARRAELDALTSESQTPAVIRRIRDDAERDAHAHGRLSQINQDAERLSDVLARYRSEATEILRGLERRHDLSRAADAELNEISAQIRDGSHPLLIAETQLGQLFNERVHAHNVAQQSLHDKQVMAMQQLQKWWAVRLAAVTEAQRAIDAAHAAFESARSHALSFKAESANAPRAKSDAATSGTIEPSKREVEMADVLEKVKSLREVYLETRRLGQAISDSANADLASREAVIRAARDSNAKNSDDKDADIAQERATVQLGIDDLRKQLELDISVRQRAADRLAASLLTEYGEDVVGLHSAARRWLEHTDLTALLGRPDKNNGEIGARLVTLAFRGRDARSELRTALSARTTLLEQLRLSGNARARNKDSIREWRDKANGLIASVADSHRRRANQLEQAATDIDDELMKLAFSGDSATLRRLASVRLHLAHHEWLALASALRLEGAGPKRPVPNRARLAQMRVNLDAQAKRLLLDHASWRWSRQALSIRVTRRVRGWELGRRVQMRKGDVLAGDVARHVALKWRPSPMPEPEARSLEPAQPGLAGVHQALSALVLVTRGAIEFVGPTDRWHFVAVFYGTRIPFGVRTR